ncbi:MAG: hypothetical protein PUC15_08310 [Lentisphaeria bacterium]|nr:hypothetical protein [Lentisphaeria bacterium]
MNQFTEYAVKLVQRGKLNMYHVIHFLAEKAACLLWRPSSVHPGFSYWYSECRLYIVRKDAADVPAYFFVFAGNPEEAIEKAFQAWDVARKDNRTKCETCRVSELCPLKTYLNWCVKAQVHCQLDTRFCAYYEPEQCLKENGND